MQVGYLGRAMKEGEWIQAEENMRNSGRAMDRVGGMRLRDIGEGQGRYKKWEEAEQDMQEVKKGKRELERDGGILGRREMEHR